MSKKALMISAALVGLLATSPAMAKATLYQLPLVSGSTETIAFGISNNGNITGYWLDSSGVEHGFVGPDTGSSYTSFDDTADGTGTQPRGLNRRGLITGIGNVSTGNPLSYVPFERKTDGTINHVTKRGTVLNYLVQGINGINIFDGSYEDPNTLEIFGYTGENARYKSKITLQGITTTSVAGRGIDDAGDTVGWYVDTSGVMHGFYQPVGGNAVTVDDPGGTTNLEGINNKGEISGLYTDTSGNRHGFVYDIATKTFTELTVSGATYVEVWGLNDHGQVAIDGLDSSTGLFVGYIYCPSARNCPTGAGSVKQQVPALHRSGFRVPLQIP
ncbi:MAG TPA: hypothetical protein VHT03_00545 [Rhizomicrobium sp.]|jgi:hypothetical protein|nr:hypothetical protein [Rhizomicrobium sp.]